MRGEINTFKRNLLGGFNRSDVIGYISRLAEERNNLRAGKEAAEEEAQRLSEIACELRERLEESERSARLTRAQALDEASKTFSLLENACDCVKASIDATSCHIRSELGKVGDSVAIMSSALKKTGERMTEILSEYEPEDELESAKEPEAVPEYTEPGAGEPEFMPGEAKTGTEPEEPGQ